MNPVILLDTIFPSLFAKLCRKPNTVLAIEISEEGIADPTPNRTSTS
jgi:hypothetical protein